MDSTELPNTAVVGESRRAFMLIPNKAYHITDLALWSLSAERDDFVVVYHADTILLFPSYKLFVSC